MTVTGSLLRTVAMQVQPQVPLYAVDRKNAWVGGTGWAVYGVTRWCPALVCTVQPGVPAPPAARSWQPSTSCGVTAAGMEGGERSLVKTAALQLTAGGSAGHYCSLTCRTRYIMFRVCGGDADAPAGPDQDPVPAADLGRGGGAGALHRGPDLHYYKAF